MVRSTQKNKQPEISSFIEYTQSDLLQPNNECKRGQNGGPNHKIIIINNNNSNLIIYINALPQFSDELLSVTE